MRKRSRLLSVAFSRLALVIGLFALPSVTVHGQTASTIPLWTGSVMVGGTPYSFTMVGKDPTATGSGPTTIQTHIIPLRFTAAPSYLFDAENNDRCSPRHEPALNMVQSSPVFRTVPSNSVLGTTLGTGQFVSLFQRANFFTFTEKGALNPNYQVTLQQTLLNREESAKRTIALPTITSPTATPNVIVGPCNPVGLIEIDTLDQAITGTILPDLFNHGVKPTSLAVFLLSNVVMYDTDATTGCCILSYHSAMIAKNGAAQTYVVANYDTSGGVFPNAPDIAAMAGAIAGWMDDPVPNSVALAATSPPQPPPAQSATPPYVVTLDDQIVPVPPGINVTQNACQTILEPVDPIFPLINDPMNPANNVFGITMNNKFTYHVPDLAFASWFYQGSASAYNSEFSLFGTLTAPAPSIPASPPC